MNELEGAGEEDVAIRELEQKEWEKEVCQERSMIQEPDEEHGEEEVTVGATEMGDERKIVVEMGQGDKMGRNERT